MCPGSCPGVVVEHPSVVLPPVIRKIPGGDTPARPGWLCVCACGGQPCPANVLKKVGARVFVPGVLVHCWVSGMTHVCVLFP